MSKTTNSEPEYDIAFRPYAIEIGFFVNAWNDLQQALRDMFCTLVHVRAAAAIWNAVPHDRSQRAMIRAAAEATIKPENPLLEEIIWLLKRVDEFGQQRDNVVHSPMAFILGTEKSEFMPNWLTGHERATKLHKGLAGEKLISELKRYRKKAIILFNHTHSLSVCVSCLLASGTSIPLPDRPTLPSALRQSERTTRNPKPHPK